MKVQAEDLKNAAYRAMEELGHSLSQIKTGTRSMIFEMEDGRTVRLRTTNDPVLICVAETNDVEAKLNVEGTDFLLLAMPEIPRTPGRVLVYLVPTQRVLTDVKESHKAWLATNPRTKGDNHTRNIWFENRGTPWSGFHDKWSEYKTIVEANAPPSLRPEEQESTQERQVLSTEPQTVAEIINRTTHEISQITGIKADKIKIELRFEA
jgi:hypothetical protein